MDYYNGLVYRLETRAKIRRNIKTRKSVQNNEPDRISDLLEESASAITHLCTTSSHSKKVYLKEKIEELSEIEFKSTYELFLLEFLWDELSTFGEK